MNSNLNKITGLVKNLDEIIFTPNQLFSANWESGSRPGPSFDANQAVNIVLGTDGEKSEVTEKRKYNYPTTDDYSGRVEVQNFTWIVVENGGYESWNTREKTCRVHGWHHQGWSATCKKCGGGSAEFDEDDDTVLVCSSCGYRDQLSDEDLADCTCDAPYYKETIIVSDEKLARGLAELYGVEYRTEPPRKLF